MSVSTSNAFRTAALAAGLALLNAGSANATGRLVLTTSSDVVVATLPLSNPAFGAPVNGVASANAITSDTNAVGGIASRAQLRDRDNIEVMRANVGASGSDINLSTTNIPAGGTVQISSLVASLQAGTTV